MLFSCASQFNKGVIEKKKLRSKKPPSVQIAEEYDKRAGKNTKTYKNPKKAARARERQAIKHKKMGDKYLKKKNKKLN
jgi:hypothetical protein